MDKDSYSASMYTYFKIHTLVYTMCLHKKTCITFDMHITSSFSCHSYKLLHSCPEGSPLIEKVLSLGKGVGRSSPNHDT